MIRSTPIAAGAEAYYLGLVAEGLEGPGHWIGRGPGDLGLAGEVGRADLAAVLAGRHPVTGATLHVRPVRVRGLELTFQVPKSVSVMWAVAGPDVAREIDTGRSTALGAAISYLEDEAVVLGANGRSAGMVGAAFPHRTSRSGDPHLHAHVIVANLGHASVDGAGWMALDRLVLDKHLHTAGHLFEAHLRHELSERLGLRFGPVRAGVAQVDGVPEAVCRRFSQRRLQVEAVMAAHGGSTAAAARLAALIDRPARHAGLSAELLAPEWLARAGQAGFGGDQVGAVLGRGRRPGSVDASLPLEERLGLTGLSTFSRRDVLRAVCAAHPDGISGAAARATVDEVLGSARVLRVTGRGPLRREDVVRTERGRVVVVATDRDRWTTRADLDASRQAAAWAEELRGASRVTIDGKLVEGVLARERGLGAAGRAAVHGLTGSRDAVQVLAARAGPAREQVLAACRRLWSGQGVRVVGACPDGAGAQRLESATGIECRDLDSVVARFAPLAAPVLTPTVLVVDGAAELASADVVRVLDTARRTGIGVVLVGDRDRIPDADRAGAWRAVAGAVGTIELERAYGRVAARDVGIERDTVVYRVGDRLALSESPDALRDRLASDWRSVWDGTPRSVMVAAGRADVEDLNGRARDLLRRDGTIDGHRRTIGGLEVHGGDCVVVAQLDGGARRLGWRAGQAWRMLPGAEALAGPGGAVRDVGAASGLSLRWGYAATPYQARHVGAEDWLVLGAPGPPAPDGGRERARYYVVAGVADGAGLAATLAREESLRSRMAARAHAAELEPPAYLVALIGPPPASSDDRRTWRAAAGAVETYRDRWGVSDGRDPFGPESYGRAPTGRDDRSMQQRAERQEVARLLRSTALRLGRSVDTGREQGRDRVRERAADR